MTEFEIGAHHYRFEGMPAQTETRLAKRLAPLLAEAVPLMLKPGPQIAIRTDIDVVKIARTALSKWGTLDDDDLDYIERATLGALSREADGTWHTVWLKGASEPAFADIDGSVMQIAMARVLGLIVKRWIEGGGEAIPADIRTVINKLH